MIKKITVILPVHKMDEEDIVMLNNSLSSVEDFRDDVKITIVCPEKISNSITYKGNLETKILRNTILKTDFINQLNLGINDCDTEWFSILEIDDEYKKPWLSSMTEYMNNFKDVDVFLPIIRDVNVEGKFMTYMNESVWAYGFSKKQGYLDNELLLEYQNYQTSGGLYRTQVIKDNGNLKDNIKLTFSYEFLLRLTHNGVNIMTVPKIGYQHVNLRENSLFWMYKNDENLKLAENEGKFWVETAKKEYFFKNKRDVIYKEN